MAQDWRKSEKALYLPGRTPQLVEVPQMHYFAVEGSGNPNTPAYQELISALYAMSMTVKMMPRKGITPEGYEPYTVYPLEGVYDVTEPWDAAHPLNKDALVYTVMMRQPAFVTPEVATLVAGMAAEKKTVSPKLAQVRFEARQEGLCVQMMHIGPYDDEPASFAQMEAFAKAEGLVRTGVTHKEIYIGDPRRAKPESLRTVLRFSVRRG